MYLRHIFDQNKTTEFCICLFPLDYTNSFCEMTNIVLFDSYHYRLALHISLLIYSSIRIHPGSFLSNKWHREFCFQCSDNELLLLLNSLSLSLFCPSLDLLSHCSAVLPDPLTSITGATKPQNFESLFQRSCDCDLFLSDILLVELLLPLPASVCPLCCLPLQKTLLTPYLLVLSSQRVHFSKATQLANS